jgi:molecular chaperone GrpE
MMANKRENKGNRIPVHFADEDAEVDSDARGGNKRDVEPRDDQKGSESVDASGTGSGVEDSQGPASLESANEDGPQQVSEPAAPLRMEGQDFEASTAPASAGDAGPPRPVPASAATGPVLAELIATRAELRRVESERAELREALARRQADFENYRKRVERERSDSYNRMVGDVVTKLLPVLDNLRRALEAEGTLQANESEEFRHFLHGVELIFKQLSGVLEGLGLQLVPALGERFDPHVHEAVVTEKTDEYEPDTVIQELVPGYRLGEKLIRPAIVKVATR